MSSFEDYVIAQLNYLEAKMNVLDAFVMAHVDNKTISTHKKSRSTVKKQRRGEG